MRRRAAVSDLKGAPILPNHTSLGQSLHVGRREGGPGRGCLPPLSLRVLPGLLALAALAALQGSES